MIAQERQFGRAFWLRWVLASGVGTAIGWAIGGLILVAAIGGVRLAGLYTVGLAVGALVGVVRWLDLRAQFSPSQWWAFLSIGGWTFGGLVLGVAVGQSSCIVRSCSATSVVLVGVLSGAVIGALLAGSQLLFLRRSISLPGWTLLVHIVAWSVGGLVLAGALFYDYLAVLGFGAVVGAWVGAAQWLALRSRVPQAVWWFLATVVGWALGSLTLLVASQLTEIEGTLDFVAVMVAFGAMVGFLSGAAQSILLRTIVFRAYWWLVASTLGWVAGSLVLAWVALAQGELTGASLMFAAGGMGAVAGGVTGIALLWLLQKPIVVE